MPSGVGAALEGFKFDGLGNGPTEYRAEDHQCFKDVLVVKGKENPSSKFDLLEVVEVTPRSQVEYPASLLGGELGPYNNGG
jgi:branched-chain amino acid transport system substrate-binding protein